MTENLVTNEAFKLQIYKKCPKYSLILQNGLGLDPEALKDERFYSAVAIVLRA